MIRAVFFDWLGTVAYYSPAREELHSQALRELGINVSPQTLAPCLLDADRYLFQETAASPLRERSPREQANILITYQQMVLTGAGLHLAPDSDTFVRLMRRLEELFRKAAFVLFDDVLPTLKVLKGQGLVLALLTNMDADMRAICRELGLAIYLDLIITSGEVKAEKPKPQIFLTALERAGVTASEAIHIGDQPKIDVAGALGVGIKPVLIDRYDLFSDVTDCPRIHALSEVARYL